MIAMPEVLSLRLGQIPVLPWTWRSTRLSRIYERTFLLPYMPLLASLVRNTPVLALGNCL
jgi:hypothetical protein